MSSDLDLYLEMESAAARARLELLQDPSAALGLVATGGRPDFKTYWRVVADLRAGVRCAAAQHWDLIQDSGEWSATFGLARRWLNAQFALSRLFAAGLARRCHVVDLIDAERALVAIQRF